MIRTSAHMTIGALARQTGVAVRTLRFYDRVGILSVHGRSDSNYRLFTADALSCVRCIRDLQGAGLTLRQIQRIVRIEGAGGDVPGALAQAYAEARDRLDRQIARLTAKRRNLSSRLARAGT